MKKLFAFLFVGTAMSLAFGVGAIAQPPKVDPPKLQDPSVKLPEKAPDKAPEKVQEKAPDKAPDKAPAKAAEAAPAKAQAPEKAPEKVLEKAPEAKVEPKEGEPKAEPVKAPSAEELVKAVKDLGDVQTSWQVGGDTMWVMITGMLVFFMNLGFACVESGMCRAKNCVNILSKNFIVFAATTIGFWLIGWGIMFGNGDDWVGKQGLWRVKGADNSPVKAVFKDALKDDVKSELGEDALKDKKVETAIDTYATDFVEKTTSNKVEKKDEKGKVVMKDGKPEEIDNTFAVKIAFGGKTLEKSYPTSNFYWGAYNGLSWTGIPLWAKFFFQLVFAGTAATIVSGAVAERIKYHSFILFSFVMAICIYPVVGHWVWGGGALQSKGFLDFAGSTQVHSIGGWAALIAVIILGPRIGKYGPGGKVNAIPGHNMTAATIGCLILWFGWFGFNPGSTMAVDAKLIAHVAITTNLAASMATLTATATAWFMMGKPDIGMTLNGCLAGLVAITAPCAFVTAESSLIIGAIAGVIVVLAVIGFDKIGIDDPVGATSVHLVNGVFGTLCVGLFAEKDLIPSANAITSPGLFVKDGTAELFLMQLRGVGMTAAYVCVVSAIAWVVIKLVFGMRVTAEEEIEGLDIGEHGNEAYHGFAMVAPEVLMGGSEPKTAKTPPDGKKRFTVSVEGLAPEKIAAIWGDLCQPTKKPSADFLAVYPKMTLLQGNKFKFIDGNPEQISAQLAKVLQASSNGGSVKTSVDK